MADFNGQIIPSIDVLLGAAFQTPTWYAQRVWSSGLGAWCYYVQTTVNSAPLATETTPNWAGAISGHEVLASFCGSGPYPALATPVGIFGSKLMSWLRADLGVSLDGSSNVAAWADQAVGTGRDYGQGTAARRPSMGTINGKPAINFDYANTEYLSLTGATYGAPAAVQVIRVNQRNADPAAAAGGGGLDDFGTFVAKSYMPFTDGVIYDSTACSATRFTAGNPTPFVFTAPNVYESISTGAKFDVLLNGSLFYTAGSGGVVVTATPTIGGAVGVTYMDGVIGEHIVLNAEASASERAMYAAYVLAYWGFVTV